MKRIFILALALSMAGCATPYQSTGFTGGFSQTPSIGPLKRVEFYGNGYTESETVQHYAWYRCAELAQEHGKPYFIAYRSLVDAARENPASDAHVGSVGNKPAAFVYIRLLDEPQPGSHSVADVLVKFKPEGVK